MNLGKLVFANTSHGVRSTDLSRQFARYRSLPSAHKRASCTTWASRAGFRAALWPMPTRIATGASTPTLPSPLPSPVVFMLGNHLASTSKIRSMLWMPAPSTCACRYFLGLRFARPRRQSIAHTLGLSETSITISTPGYGKLHEVGKYRVRSIITAQATIRYLVTWVALTRFIGWRTIRPTVVK